MPGSGPLGGVDIHNPQMYQVSVPILLTICTVAAITNVEVVICVYWLRLRRRSPTLSFTVSLTAADAWVAVIMAVGLLINNVIPTFMEKPIQNIACLTLAIEGLRVGAMITSVLHLFILAINHYCGVFKPLKYKVSMTSNKTYSCIVTLWALPTFTIFLFLSVVPNQAFLSSGCTQLEFYFYSAFRQSISAFIFIPLVCMIGIYAHIFAHIHYRKLFKHAANSFNNRISAAEQKSTKAIITTALILGTFIFGWLPAFVRFVAICCDCAMKPDQFGQGVAYGLGVTTNLLILLKCLVDPIIYATRMCEIRTGLELMHVFCCCRKTYKGMTKRQTIQMRLASRKGQSSYYGSRGKERSGIKSRLEFQQSNDSCPQSRKSNFSGSANNSAQDDNNNQDQRQGSTSRRSTDIQSSQGRPRYFTLSDAQDTSSTYVKWIDSATKMEEKPQSQNSEFEDLDSIDDSIFKPLTDVKNNHLRSLEMEGLIVQYLDETDL